MYTGDMSETTKLLQAVEQHKLELAERDEIIADLEMLKAGFDAKVRTMEENHAEDRAVWQKEFNHLMEQKMMAVGRKEAFKEMYLELLHRMKTDVADYVEDRETWRHND
jgi:hypothetical protein